MIDKSLPKAGTFFICSHAMLLLGNMLQTEGIILKKNNQGEAGATFRFLTRDFGKLTFTVKAVRKITSKLRPGLQPFSLIYLGFVPGKNNKIITEATTIKNFPGIKDDLNKLQAGFYICSILDKFLKENEKDDNIWNLAITTLQQLEQVEQNHLLLGALLRYFEFQFIKALGYMPELYLCVVCGGRIKEENNFLSMVEGGLVCPACVKQQPINNRQLTTDGRRQTTNNRRPAINNKIEPETIKILRLFFEKPFDFVKRLKLSKENSRELKKISKDILEYISEARINLV